uniref:Uncharacterized protein n=1 Tax=Oryza brachyantha TaxID=4533 RepID=J3L462_ORYBR
MDDFLSSEPDAMIAATIPLIQFKSTFWSASSQRHVQYSGILVRASVKQGCTCG